MNVAPTPNVVEQRDTGACPPAAPVSEHAQLTAGTADMWRQLVHLCIETPLPT